MATVAIVCNLPSLAILEARKCFDLRNRSKQDD
jgi:hypothetical protein